MLRLITSRWVRLALVAAAVAAIVVAVLRLRRSPAVPGDALRAEIAPGSGLGPEVEAVPAPSSQWPPAPILGTPTADDLKRYAVRPYIPRFLAPDSPPRKPLDDLTRRRLTRWGAVAVALCLLVFGTQALENATFSNDETTASSQEEEYTEEHSFSADNLHVLDGRDCMPASPRPDGWFTAVCKKEAEPERAGSGGGENAPTFQDPIPAPEERAEVPDADCAPAVRTPAARKVNPRVTRAVNRQWARIERWLKANAPASRRTLRGPARPRTIAVAEAQMGLRFPNDLRASLLRHNGAAAVGGASPFGFLSNGFLGVREIRDTWRGLCEIDGEAEGSDPRTEWWDGRMIPFGTDGSGDHLVVDSVRRDVGETDYEGQMSFTPGGVPIRSHYALLKAVADAMETGGAVGYWKPGVTGGEFGWDVVD